MMHFGVFSAIALACLAPLIHRWTPRNSSWIVSLLPFGLGLYLASLSDDLARGEQYLETTEWLPALGLELAFRLDGLSLVFSLLITVIGGFILIYAGAYLKGHAQLGRLLAFLLLFMAAMLGLVLADNLLLLFISWELTSVSSYLLIGFDHERESARAAALQALLVTGLGGMALLAGALLLQQITGTLSISTILQRGGEIRTHALYLPALLLVLAGAFTKSAQFPFHFWLPAAMEAPTPVSAYLHSATMVKAGIYLMARLHPALGGTDAWMSTLVVAGGATMVVGAALSYVKSDLKQILAYSTVSALGMLTLALGSAGELGTRAAMVFLIAHSLYKGALFMVAGVLDHEAGTRDVNVLGGLRKAMPVTAVAAALAALSMAGLPPLFGFIGKELFYEASQGSALWAPVMIAVAMFTGVLTVAAAGLSGLRPFIGPARPTPTPAHEAPWGLWIGPLMLGLVGLYFGLAPGFVGARLVSRATAEVLGVPTVVKLTLYHGLNFTLWLSVFTILAGAAVFVYRDRAYDRVSFLGTPIAWGPAGIYQYALRGLIALAEWQTRLLQNGYLPHYLRVVLITTVALVGVALARQAGPPQENLLRDVRPYEALVGVLIVAGALSSVASNSRLAAITSLGVVALGLALTFVLFGAPDLAMTQFLVETLTVILIVLVMYHLPGYTPESSRRNRLRDGLVAVAGGTLMTVLVLGVTSIQIAPQISTYYVENSYKLAHGRNIVNVILVDFRGLDTFGEITVLSIAALGVFALLKLRPRPEKEDLP
jgi:multicomponent Na+:H+ antiporter subunit A